MTHECCTPPVGLPICSIKRHAEDVQALFPSVLAVVEAADEVVRHYIRNAPFEGGTREYLVTHAESLMNLLSVVSHLLYEMEDTQSLVISMIAGHSEAGTYNPDNQ